MNSEDENTEEVIQTDEFVQVCEELGLLEPTVNDITEDMWSSAIHNFEDSRW